MNVSWKDDEVARARRRQLQREADLERLAKGAIRLQRQVPGWHVWPSAMMSRLGTWMVATGCRLQARYSNALAGSPIVTRIELSDSRVGTVSITHGC